MTKRTIFTGIFTFLLGSLLPSILSAQRGNIIITTGASISVPLGAVICADTVFANGSGHGTLTLADPSCLCSGSVVIPVELVSFSGVYQNGVVTLRWVTASETNCAGYDIERMDGKERWEQVGFVEGSGTSREERIYHFIDRLSSELLELSTLQYRLKVVDTDGSIDYSPVIEVPITGLPQTVELMALYPNPVADYFVVPFTLPSAMNVEITVYSFTGKLMFRISGGEFGMGRHALKVCTSSLSSGTYLVECVAGDRRNVQEIAVQR